MKSLLEYIHEAHREFVYRIKIAGELDKDDLEKFKMGLGKFDLTTATTPKKTPIQKDPMGFPGLSNQEIHIFDITINYPASIDEIRNAARLAGFDINNVVVMDKEHNDSLNKEAEEMETGTKLETPEYPQSNKDQNDAKDAYADSYQSAASEFAGEANIKYEIAGGKPDAAKFNTDTPDGKDSPMSKIKRRTLKDIMK